MLHTTGSTVTIIHGAGFLFISFYAVTANQNFYSFQNGYIFATFAILFLSFFGLPIFQLLHDYVVYISEALQ